MPTSSAALKPLSADALTPRPRPAPQSASLHPASQHSLAPRPAPLAKAHSEKQVLLTSAPCAGDPKPLQPPVFAPKADPVPPEDDWAALLIGEADEDDADEPAQDFALHLPEPVPVSLFEEIASPRKARWPWVLMWGLVAAAIAAGAALQMLHVL